MTDPALPREYLHPVRVYREDTDSTGFVHHANFLRFLARARMEAFEQSGCGVTQWAARGLTFPVYSVQVTFEAPARENEDLVVISTGRPTSTFRFAFDQRIERVSNRCVLVRATVELVGLDREGKLKPLPELNLR